MESVARENEARRLKMLYEREQGRDESMFPHSEPEQRSGMNVYLDSEEQKQKERSDKDEGQVGFQCQTVFSPLVGGVESGVEKLVKLIDKLRSKTDELKERSNYEKKILCNLLEIPTSTPDPFSHLVHKFESWDEDRVKVFRRLELLVKSLREEVDEAKDERLQSSSMARRRSGRDTPITIWDRVFECVTKVKEEMVKLKQVTVGERQRRESQKNRLPKLQNKAPSLTEDTLHQKEAPAVRTLDLLMRLDK
ncbi:hypothetical protein Ciccas_002368 [Cichlidogyrus casuarinus]|uniref:Uncharacterized protein n=1 Tax=Cichlidogyrus casuarinus TaxID=1844966 RepID=A0ABD2QHT2_9PLAT